jgi:hypothetical protein
MECEPYTVIICALRVQCIKLLPTVFRWSDFACHGTHYLDASTYVDMMLDYYCVRSYGIWEAFILMLGISYGCSYLRTAQVCSNVHLSKIFIYNLWLSRVHNLGIICSCCCSQGVPTGALELSLFNRTLHFLILVHQYQLIAIFQG